MKKTALSLAVGAALAMNVAIAEQPVPLTEDQLDGVTAAGFGFVEFEVFIDFDKDVNIDIDKDVFQDIQYTVNANGYIAEADAAANCSHFSDCKATTLTATDVNLNDFFNGTGLPYTTSVSESGSYAPSLIP